MRKKLLKLSLYFTLVLIVFIVVFVIINLIDGPEPKGTFTIKDLYPATLESDNSFYQIMAFSYPPEIDITSSEVIGELRKMSEPKVLKLNNSEMHDLFKNYFNLTKKLTVQKSEKKVNVYTQTSNEDFERIVVEKNGILNLIKSNQLLMQRYNDLIQKEKVEDFSLTTVSYPLPDHLTILKITKLYTAANIISALEGKWQEGVAGILKQVNFFRKFSRNSRWQINKLVNLGIINISLKGVAFIMNQKNCPEEIFTMVYNGLPPLKEAEISFRNPLIFEFLRGVQMIDEIRNSKKAQFGDVAVLSGFWPSASSWLNFLTKFKIFLNRNRTIQLYLDGTKPVFEFEKTLPFRWKQDLAVLAPSDPTEKLFWWISNPIGKATWGTSYVNYQKSIFKKYRTKCMFDLTRICAELYIKSIGEKPLSDILNELDSYRTIDPFSGKAYVVDNDKQIIYGVGENRLDDGGSEAQDEQGDTKDLVISIRFFRKAENK